LRHLVKAAAEAAAEAALLLTAEATLLTAKATKATNAIKAGGKGGAPGQWSARKAQMMAKQYKAKGGGYK